MHQPRALRERPPAIIIVKGFGMIVRRKRPVGNLR
jgi:hypothetical protein